MTIRDTLKKNPKIEADLLLAHVLKKPGEFLYLNPEKNLNAAQARRFAALANRRQKGEPVAYLVGYKDFYGLSFTVNRRVLIPRPETEWLVERGAELAAELKKIKGLRAPVRILDLGTGSGCIIISLAKCLRGGNYEFFASDISKNALSVAKFNAVKHKVKIKFFHGNLFNRLPGPFELIIANLPYVPVDDYRKLKANLRFEPKIALSDGGNAWKLYYRFFQQLPDQIAKGARVILEIDPKSVSTLKKYQARFLPRKKIEFSKNLRGQWRYAQVC